jgi:hypothetical protein
MPAALEDCLTIYNCYIDDGIGIWIGTKPQWPAFKQWINSFGTLHWIFTEPSLKINYLDITIQIDATMSICTNLFEKPLNLYLYRSVQPTPLES